MEQMANQPELTLVRHDRDPASPWRSVGLLAAGWVERVEAQRAASDPGSASFEPVAWAAE